MRGAMVAVVGVDLECGEGVQLVDGVDGSHSVASVDMLALRRPSSVEAAEQARGRRAHVRTAEMVCQVGIPKVLVVASFQRADGLEGIGEHHPRQSQQGLKPVPAVLHMSSPHLFLSERLELRLVRQLDVHRHLVAWHILLHTPAVMVAHDLHVRHIVSRDVACG